MDPIEILAQAQARGTEHRPRSNGFPYLAEALREAGIRVVTFDVASASARYTSDTAVVHHPGRLLHSQPVLVPAFDQRLLVAAIEADQRGEVAFHDFLVRIWSAGVVSYVVDLDRQTCSYAGVLPADHYTESYPRVRLGA